MDAHQRENIYMSIKASATVRQDLLDQIEDGVLSAPWFARTVLSWMNEDDCREMVTKMADFEETVELSGWEESEDEDGMFTVFEWRHYDDADTKCENGVSFSYDTLQEALDNIEKVLEVAHKNGDCRIELWESFGDEDGPDVETFHLVRVVNYAVLVS